MTHPTLTGRTRPNGLCFGIGHEKFFPLIFNDLRYLEKKITLKFWWFGKHPYICGVIRQQPKHKHAMRIFANCQVVKLREYSRSYGSPQKVEVAYIHEHPDHIKLMSRTGLHLRTMKKGTKLLIDWAGTEITERTYKMRTKKAMAERERERERERIERERKQRMAELDATIELQKWSAFLKANPERVAKYRAKFKAANHSRGKSLLCMKFAKHCNEGKFERACSASQLRDTFLSIASII